MAGLVIDGQFSPIQVANLKSAACAVMEGF